MSYRNPGQIYIANPNAFMEAFEKGIAPIKEKLEQKIKERKEREAKYDTANAQLKKSLNYPEWVNKYGKQKADTLKSMIEEDYISNNRFASATQSEQQDMLDELNVNITNIAQKTDAAIQLDYDEILPGHFEDNQEFLDFLASKPDQGSDISIERIDGQVGFSYMKDGQKIFLPESKIPDGAINYQGKTATNDVINKAILAAKDDVDDKFTTAKTMSEASGYTQTKAKQIYNALDEAQREYLFEEMQLDLNGDEEGTGNYSYSDVMENEDLRKLLDQGMEAYLTNRIENESRQLTRLRSEEEVRMREAREKAAEEAAKTKPVSTKEEIDNYVGGLDDTQIITLTRRLYPNLSINKNGQYEIPSDDPEEAPTVLTRDALVGTVAKYYKDNPAAWATAKKGVEEFVPIGPQRETKYTPEQQAAIDKYLPK